MAVRTKRHNRIKRSETKQYSKTKQYNKTKRNKTKCNKTKRYSKTKCNKTKRYSKTKCNKTKRNKTKQYSKTITRGGGMVDDLFARFNANTQTQLTLAGYDDHIYQFCLRLTKYFDTQEDDFFDHISNMRKQPTIFKSGLFENFMRIRISKDSNKNVEKKYNQYYPNLTEKAKESESIITNNLIKTVNQLKTHGTVTQKEALSDSNLNQSIKDHDIQYDKVTGMLIVTPYIIQECVALINVLLTTGIQILPLPADDAYNFNVKTYENIGEIPDDNVKFKSGNEYVMGNNNDEENEEENENVGDVDANFVKKNDNAIFDKGMPYEKDDNV